MATFFLVLSIFGVLFLGMAIGVILQNKPIKGSCGGLNNIGLGGECDICGGNRDKCETESDKSDKTVADLAYDATKK